MRAPPTRDESCPPRRYPRRRSHDRRSVNPNLRHARRPRADAASMSPPSSPSPPPSHAGRVVRRWSQAAAAARRAAPHTVPRGVDQHRRPPRSDAAWLPASSSSPPLSSASVPGAVSGEAARASRGRLAAWWVHPPRLAATNLPHCHLLVHLRPLSLDESTWLPNPPPTGFRSRCGFRRARSSRVLREARR